MLDPKTSRLLYAEQLAPPIGFEFSCAVATSYSVDLEALLAIPLSLYFGDSLDGDIRGEKLALLECIGRIKNNVKVFYQAGKINPPAKFNRLFTLLEPCLHQVVPEGGEFSSFHPKLWLLRYVIDSTNKGSKAVRYRLVVLSRNLTFDRSWDISACVDGIVEPEHSNIEETGQLESFLRQLLVKVKGFKPAPTILAEFSQIKWQVPAPFNKMEVLVGLPQSQVPLRFSKKNYDQIAVISPFLRSADSSANALTWLSKLTSENRILFSREEELNRVAPTHLENWRCHKFNPELVNAEERLELDKDTPDQFSKLQNLHAKLIVTTSGNLTEWHLGSANATSAALGKDKTDKPRNTEIMLRLVGPTAKVGVQKLLEQWMPENGLKIFKPFEPELMEYDEGNATVDALFRRLEHSLIREKWTLIASKQPETHIYELELSANLKDPVGCSDIAVLVEQMAVTGSKPLQHKMVWDNVPLTAISAFIQIRLEHIPTGIRKLLIVKAELNIKGGEDRSQAITRELVDSPVKVFNYLHLLLQQQPDKQLWQAIDSHGEAGNGSHAFNDMPLLEQLLMATSRQPALLQKVASTLKNFENAGVIIPEELKQLWKHFGKESRNGSSLGTA